MQLNETSKNELRRLIEEKVAQIPDGERIHLDKDLLDSLLFYKLYLQKSKETIKIPIWSGDFLSKIDLSEISFDNVVFNVSLFLDNSICEFFESGEISELEENMLKDMLNKYFMVDRRFQPVVYRYTNANIVKILDDNINIVDFEGTDLSKLSLSGLRVNQSNLSYTNINTANLTSEWFYVYDCTYSNEYAGLDFSGITLDLNIICQEKDDVNLSRERGHVIDNFFNTGINFTGNIDESYYFSSMLENGRLNGCYLDGQLIQNNVLPPKNAREAEQRANKEQILQQYEAYKKGIFDEVLGGIDEQISSMKR